MLFLPFPTTPSVRAFTNMGKGSGSRDYIHHLAPPSHRLWVWYRQSDEAAASATVQCSGYGGTERSIPGEIQALLGGGWEQSGEKNSQRSSGQPSLLLRTLVFSVYVCVCVCVCTRVRACGACVCILQEFVPENGRYDVIWCQWVLSHLSNGT